MDRPKFTDVVVACLRNRFGDQIVEVCGDDWNLDVWLRVPDYRGEGVRALVRIPRDPHFDTAGLWCKEHLGISLESALHESKMYVERNPLTPEEKDTIPGEETVKVDLDPSAAAARDLVERINRETLEGGA